MEKIFFASTFILLVSICSQGLAQDPEAIKGKWYNSEKDAQVEIFQEGNKYYGKIVWLEEPTANGKPKIDINNPDKSKINRPLMGLRMLNDFEYKTDSWQDGTIYDPKNGKNYNCSIHLKDENTLEIQGFIGISLIGRSVLWTRVE